MDSLFRKFLSWAAFGAGIFATVALGWFAASYAAAAWGALPNAATNTPVSSTAWNDIVSQVNMLANGSWAIGVGQTWQNVTSSRAFGTTYTNATGKPILVSYGVVNNAASDTTSSAAVVNGVMVSYTGENANRRSSVSFVVPAGANYSVTAATNGGPLSLAYWSELR